MGDHTSIEIMAVRESDDVHHVFVGPHRDKGHVTTRGVDCPCEPEVNIVRVADEVIRLFIHDYRVLPCR